MGYIFFTRSTLPPGIKHLRRLRGTEFSYGAYKTSVLVLTFLAYSLYHVSRKPTSIVKDVLQSGSSEDHLHISTHSERRGSLQGSGWAPFNSESGTELLADIDVAFLTSYAVGMFFAGHLGDRLCNRCFLTVGMIGSGVCTSLFGMAYWWDVHWLGYFFVVQVAAGFFQATGWPSVVAIVARWAGKSKRGLIMGVWNAHTSVGNSLGSLICSAVLDYGWGWSFVVPGICAAAGGILVFLFLVPDPAIVGYSVLYTGETMTYGMEGRTSDIERGFDAKSEPLLKVMQAEITSKNEEEDENAVSFMKAWFIPGVALYALCLFFSKLVAYTFLYWLPFYISHTEIDGKYLADTTSGNVSAFFDAGGVLGGILAGCISDYMRAYAITAAAFMYMSIPALYAYRALGSISLWLNLSLMFVTGMLVNGPYSLITTVVSADLGTHPSLKHNSRALATVTAIIDGTGSVGAAIGPLLTGYISDVSWDFVFAMLMMSAFFAGLLLTKLVITEMKEWGHRGKKHSIRTVLT